MNQRDSAEFGAALSRAVSRSGSGLPSAGWYPPSAPVIETKVCASAINHLACFHRITEKRDDGRLLCAASRELRAECRWARILPMTTTSDEEQP